MQLNEVKKLLVGTIKQSFTNKKTLDKLDDKKGFLEYNGCKLNNAPVFVSDDAPVGNIIAFMGNKAPEDYLVCDGTEYQIIEYPLLAQHILDEFGSYNYFGGDGTATFAVPDLRGEFLRGTGTATRDSGSGANVGEHQNGTLNTCVAVESNGNVYFTKQSSDGTLVLSNVDKYVYDENKRIDIITKGTVYTGNEGPYATISRPTNTSVLYCIKYQITQNNLSKDMVSYSLEEQVIGSWIDGKPLYEKVINFTSPSSATTASIYDISNIDYDNIFIENGFIEQKGSIAPLQFGSNISVWINTRISSIPNTIRINVSSTYTSCETIVVLRYTKNTDAPNSFTPEMLSNIKTLNTTASEEDINEVLGY